MIKRNHLENWIPIADAQKLVAEFLNDRATYPDYEFYSHKRGINKDILEEFHPLLLFADSLSSAASLRLSPNSMPGPDGAILLKDGTEIAVQITSSRERNDGYKERLILRDNGQLFKKDLTMNGSIAERLEQIIEAIKDKETNFSTGAEVLLVVDDSTYWVPGLPHVLEEAVVSLPPSKYSATYVIFRTDVKQVR